jgi:hypothetical protein
MMDALQERNRNEVWRLKTEGINTRKHRDTQRSKLVQTSKYIMVMFIRALIDPHQAWPLFRPNGRVLGFQSRPGSEKVGRKPGHQMNNILDPTLSVFFNLSPCEDKTLNFK